MLLMRLLRFGQQINSDTYKQERGHLTISPAAPVQLNRRHSQIPDLGFSAKEVQSLKEELISFLPASDLGGNKAAH